MAWALGAIVVFSVAANGAHDLWAATAVCLTVLAAASLFLWTRGWRRGAPGLKLDLLPALGAAAAAAALSAAAAARPGDAVTRFGDVGAALAVFWIGLHACQSERGLRVVTGAAGVAVWVEACALAWQKVTMGLAGMPLQELTPGFDWRTLVFIGASQVPGTLVNSNAAAAFVLPWLAAFWALGQEAAPGSAARRLWRATLGAGIFALALTNCVWGFLCAFAAAPWVAGPGVLAARVRRRPREFAALAAGLAAAGAAFVVWKVTRTHYITGYPIAAGDSFVRLRWWQAGWRMFLDHPWLGVGLGNFPSAFPAYRTPGALATLWPHSAPVGVLAQTGAVGAAAAAWLLASWRRRLAGGAAEGRRRWPWVLGTTVLLAFSCASLGIEYLAVLLSLALLAACAAAPGGGRERRVRPMAVVVGWAVFAASAPFLLARWQASRLVVSGTQSLQAGDPAAAWRAFSAAAELDPLSWEAELGMARARPQSSEEHLRRALRLDRFNPYLRRELGLPEGRPPTGVR